MYCKVPRCEGETAGRLAWVQRPAQRRGAGTCEDSGEGWMYRFIRRVYSIGHWGMVVMMMDDDDAAVMNNDDCPNRQHSSTNVAV